MYHPDEPPPPGTGPDSVDEAANQDDFISFDFIDQLDGPGPASEAQGRAQSRHNRRTPAGRQAGNTGARSVPVGRGGGYDQRRGMSEPRYAAGFYLDMDLLAPLPVPPWVPRERVYSKNLLKMFHEEIDDYVNFLVPTPAEHEMRELTVRRIRKVVHDLWGNKCKVYVFGSFETKLYLPSSDVDVVVIGQRADLKTLHEAIGKANIASEIKSVTNARVPIIKIVDSVTGYPADISFNIDNGIHGAKIVQTFLDDAKYGEGIRPLLLIMKQFLVQRNMNEVFTGGMGSYALISIIAAFLKTHPKVQTGAIRPRDNLGVLLLEFLDLYGIQLDPDHVAVGLTQEDAWYFPKSEAYRYRLQQKKGSIGKIIVMDPQDSANDIAGGSFAWGVIRGQMRQSFQVLQGIIGAGYERGKRGYRVQVPTLLGHILSVRKEVMEHRERVHEVYEKIKDRMDEFVTGPYEGLPVLGVKRKREDEDDELPMPTHGKFKLPTKYGPNARAIAQPASHKGKNKNKQTSQAKQAHEAFEARPQKKVKTVARQRTAAWVHSEKDVIFVEDDSDGVLPVRAEMISSEEVEVGDEDLVQRGQSLLTGKKTKKQAKKAKNADKMRERIEERG